MSLALEIDDIYQVKIGNEWFDIEDKSLVLDSYEFINNPKKEPLELDYIVHRGGESGICATGFRDRKSTRLNSSHTT
jgi:hypothetical protein